MKPLISILLLVALAFFLASCSDSDSIFNLPGQKDKMEFTMTGSADGLTTAPAGMDKPYRHFEGDGTNTPGGQSHVVMDYWAIPLTPTTGVPAFGNAVLITETGDEIFGINIRGTYVINPTTHIVTCDIYFDLAGGTGEYDNIVGTVHCTVTINQDRTTHGEWTGTFSHAKPFGGEIIVNNGTVQNPSCDAGYTRRHSTGGGTVLHFGNCSVETEHCINFTTGVMKNGVGTFNIPGGDQVYVTYDGYAVPVPGTNKASVKMFCTITGGTGKYTNASGFILANVLQTMPEGEATGILDGVIDW